LDAGLGPEAAFHLCTRPKTIPKGLRYAPDGSTFKEQYWTQVNYLNHWKKMVSSEINLFLLL